MNLQKIIIRIGGVPKIFEKGWGPYDHNQIYLVENFIQVFAKKISTLNQSLFLRLFSLKKGLHFESITDFMIFVSED